MPGDRKVDEIQYTRPAPGSHPANSPAQDSDILQKFALQLDLIHPAKISEHLNRTALNPPPPACAAQAGLGGDWEQEDAVQKMISSLLTGAFDENMAMHAEDLAERLIERQRELDRRESQLNLRSAELENAMRQLRLENVPMQAASEIEKTIEAELAVYEESAAEKVAVSDELKQDLAEQIRQTPDQPAEEAVSESVEVAAETADVKPAADEPADQSDGDNVVTHRLDKFSASQRAPYSLLNKRWKRYIEDTKADHSLKIHAQQTAQSNPTSDEPARMDAANRAEMAELTRRAAAVRQRSEEVEKMYEQLRGIFSEMLRQQTTMRQVIKTLRTDGQKANPAELEAAKSTLDRLTVGLSRIGNRHFLLPEASSDAA